MMGMNQVELDRPNPSSSFPRDTFPHPSPRSETAFHKIEACSEATLTHSRTSCPLCKPLLFPGHKPDAKGHTFQFPTGQGRRKAQGEEVFLLPTPPLPALSPEALSYLHQFPITLANSQEIN